MRLIIMDELKEIYAMMEALVQDKNQRIAELGNALEREQVKHDTLDHQYKQLKAKYEKLETKTRNIFNAVTQVGDA